ncbi:hypothetical protein AURDEDRAFT_130962 [Auricularia subglabra TFB-10046 SS5]|uniref:Uncharacterized protein n=1 Tax=Auricularia subglabra (strain TFB-10046 / SS5) TaxID=717982 RepID=J0LDQ8_AURST|nr:hypothetical protein AURDEDRAFT_130962 [Auricularia subglabra TFB-10046 SS5]
MSPVISAKLVSFLKNEVGDPPELGTDWCRRRDPDYEKCDVRYLTNPPPQDLRQRYAVYYIKMLEELAAIAEKCKTCQGKKPSDRKRARNDTEDSSPAGKRQKSSPIKSETSTPLKAEPAAGPSRPRGPQASSSQSTAGPSSPLKGKLAGKKEAPQPGLKTGVPDDDDCIVISSDEETVAKPAVKKPAAKKPAEKKPVAKKSAPKCKPVARPDVFSGYFSDDEA